MNHLLQLFDGTRQNQPNLHEKVAAVAGDIFEPKLGLSDEDEEKLMSEVSVVFHSAATVRFDEPLK